MDNSLYKKQNSGFTLLEVLLALTVIAIAFTALLRALIQSTTLTQQLKTKTIQHWVALQGIYMIQLRLLTLPAHNISTQKTIMFHQTWYWQAQHTPTPIDNVEKITVTVSQQATGPFRNPLYAFRYHPHVDLTY